MGAVPFQVEPGGKLGYNANIGNRSLYNIFSFLQGIHVLYHHVLLPSLKTVKCKGILPSLPQVLSSFNLPDATTVYNTTRDLLADPDIASLNQFPLLNGTEFGASNTSEKGWGGGKDALVAGLGLAMLSAGYEQKLLGTIINKDLMLENTSSSGDSAQGDAWAVPPSKPLSRKSVQCNCLSRSLA